MTYEISTFRLYLLRASYLILVVGLGLEIWPEILDPNKTWPLSKGVVVSMLGALSMLALLGLRYPLKMLPLLFFEMLWKSIWLSRMALPLWYSGTMDQATLETVYACLGIVVFPLVVPWDYVFAHYIRAAGDRWGSVSTSGALSPKAAGDVG